MTEIKLGTRINNWLIIDQRDSGKSRKSWLCECVCGNKKVMPRCRLLGIGSTRASKSCGCKEYKHDGLLKTEASKRIYNIWYEMNKRCSDPKADNFERYGGSGVTVCDEWRNDFKAFYEWSKNNGYEDDLTIDRVDSKKPYNPENCRWADYYVQMQNRGKMGNNTSGVNGVSFNKKINKYSAYIRRNDIKKNLGSFETLEEAAKARKRADEHFEKHGTIENL